MQDDEKKVLKQGLTEAILTTWGRYCSICGTQRLEENIQVVYAAADTALVHLSCSKCDKQFVLNVAGVGFQMMPVLTDLDHTEIEKFGNTASVTPDDLIEVHKILFENKTANSLTKKIHSHHNLNTEQA